MTLLTIKEASKFVTKKFGESITPSNISYLIQYGRIRKVGNNSNTRVFQEDLIKYYQSRNKEKQWKQQLGDDLNWKLSFDNVREKDRTKHVHRLHPYKGKFIPQLVEYFLDDHVDDFKKEVIFHKDDIVLDPFCGSGTTLVQANELGLNAIGIDISVFNTLISNVKVKKHDIFELQRQINKITRSLLEFTYNAKNIEFEEELLEKLSEFNNRFFPSPEYKYRVRNKEINGWEFGRQKEKEFLDIYKKLVKKYDLDIIQGNSRNFLEKWFFKPVKKEINFVNSLIQKVADEDIKQILEIILSRTIRSCRATKHSDLATLKKPIHTTYYCPKHYKICKPIFTILNWWKRYSKDTVDRLSQFDRLRTNSYQQCFTGDSKNFDIFAAVKKKDENFYPILKSKKIKGIFSSPPYVGLINYHRQHAYAYELFDFENREDKEIGPLFKGKGLKARESYIEGISQVLLNCKKYMVKEYDVLLVANDKFGLYPRIAEKAGMKIVKQYKRPVLNRTEKDKSAYSEIIFHLKAK
jgi:hypothetical protein